MRYVMLFLVVVVALFGMSIPVTAQSDAVTISVAVPFFSADLFDQDFIAEFEAANPGITLHIVRSDENIPAPAQGLEAHLTAVQAYVSSADVVFIDSRTRTITPEATRAGYFLDLSPLVGVDTQLNVDDFYPAAWQSFQWDRGIWALPTALDFVVITYDEEDFNLAGLALPNERWSLFELADAAAKLTVKDQSGNVTQAGLGVSSAASPALFRSLLSAPLYDNSQIPNILEITSAEAENLLTQWRDLDQNGYLGNSNNGPLAVTFLSNGLRGPRANNPRGFSLLPGGVSGLVPQGVAISAGTRYPDQAYAVARWLTLRTELTARFSIAPARQSMVGMGGGGRNNLPADQQAFIAQAIASAQPLSEARFADRLSAALTKMKEEGVDAKTALEAIEAQAVQDLTAADAKKGTVAIEVATPPPPVVLAPGEIAIKFGVESFQGGLPNQEAWNALAAEFTATDGQVKAVTLEPILRTGSLQNLTDTYDCFYIAGNIVPGADLSLLLNVDPFMAADPTFDKDDVLAGLLSQLTRDNKIWALPLIIEPSILRYDRIGFDKSRVIPPELTWTVQNFTDTLHSLRIDPGDPAPFAATNANGGHLLILIAAYGGLPFDYSVSPVGINFTDPKTVDAIQQVLDLAKQGYIKYDSLATIAFGRGLADIENPIYTDVLNTFSARRAANIGGQGSDYRPIVYPIGTEFYAATYSVGAGYISAKTAAAEGCYRWLSAVARHPELFNAMPARRSLINDPVISATQGPDLTALYNRITELLNDPKTVVLPSLTAGSISGGATSFLLQRWLYEAFDTYVLQNGDLNEALRTAESYAKAYVECIAALPPYDPTAQSIQQYNRQFVGCATKVDSRLSGMFGGFGGQGQ